MDTIIHKDNIFIIGGETDKSNPTNLCCKYSISKNIWEKLPQLKHKKSHKAITIIQEKLLLLVVNQMRKLLIFLKY